MIHLQANEVLQTFSDIFLSTAMIPKWRPNNWINRHGFMTRKRVILQWLFLGHILTLGYTSTLLSTLIPIRYEGTIDTLQDMAESGLPFTIPHSTSLHKLLATDPRPTMMKIYKRKYLMDPVRNSAAQDKLDEMC